MKLYTRHVVAVVAVGLCLVASSSEAGPNSSSFEKEAPPEELRRLSAEWWQWALSIPTSVNPLRPPIDPTVENCMIGQRGPIWFLPGGVAVPTALPPCTVPEGKELFFPAVNAMEANSPNVCGQGPEDLSVEKMRSDNAAFVDNVSHLKVTLDGKPIHHLHRVQSDVFDITLPEDNIFDALCAGDSPAGVYSPAVGDGIYVFLKPLDAGTHTLQIQATSGDISVDTTYHLVVVPVKLR
jgi:hypothetical protein